MNIVDVSVVYGDFGNFGTGSLIGVFDDVKRAEKAAKGRGSLDCGGDGRIEDRKAIKDGDDFYLLELNFPVKVNFVLKPSPEDEDDICDIIVTKIHDRIEFMRFFRRETCLSLRNVKEFVDIFDLYGTAQFPKNQFAVDGKYWKDRSIQWKQELELNNIAELEIK